MLMNYAHHNTASMLEISVLYFEGSGSGEGNFYLFYHEDIFIIFNIFIFNVLLVIIHYEHGP